MYARGEGASQPTGVNCHVSEVPGVTGSMIIWQRTCAPIVNGLSTLIDWSWQRSVSVAGALVAASHVPRPSRGTSATSKDGLSRPVSTPLDTFSAGALASDLSLETVALEELFPSASLVIDGAVDALISCVGFAVLVTVLVVVVVVVVGLGLSARVRVVRPRVGARDVVVVVAVLRVRGAELDEAVNVKTRTRSNRGLDHITQCELFKERNSRIVILEG
jgi:hypothetical protein